MKIISRLIFGVFIYGCLATTINAQSASTYDDEDIQSWNDIQFTRRLSKQFDFYSQITLRFGGNITQLADGRFSIGFPWKATGSLTISPIFTYKRARNSTGRFRTENELILRGVYRFPFKRFGLSHRSQFEYRIRQPVNSWRYRPSLTFEKEIPERFISKAKFFVTEEPFYDSVTRRFSRNRFSLGISKSVNRHFTLDVYYLRQNDGFSHPGDLNVIGTTWKFKL